MPLVYITLTRYKNISIIIVRFGYAYSFTSKLLIPNDNCIWKRYYCYNDHNILLLSTSRTRYLNYFSPLIMMHFCNIVDQEYRGMNVMSIRYKKKIFFLKNGLFTRAKGARCHVDDKNYFYLTS